MQLLLPEQSGLQQQLLLLLLLVGGSVFAWMANDRTWGWQWKVQVSERL